LFIGEVVGKNRLVVRPAAQEIEMEDRNLTRRRFAGLAAATAAVQVMDLRGATAASGSGLSAGELVKRISAASGVSLPDRPVDGFKAGKESAIVRGIAVTSMATMEVLRKAGNSRLNLVLSFEPTFFGRNDGESAAGVRGGGGPGGAGVAADDPILLAKRQFIQGNGMVVYRLHDQWAARKENEHAKALANAMGWTRAAGDSATDYQINPAPLSEIVAQVRAKLQTRGGLRVVGDPHGQIRRVVVLPGVQNIATLVAKLPSTDLILAGETRDWEGAEYFSDASAAGLNKGLITVGKVVSADPGMRACAAWIRTFVKEVPVQWISAGEPFWSPA
jgi:hypothetical protein